MEAAPITTSMTPCGGALPELQVPMIKAMVSCLGSEHRKFDEHILQLAVAATRLSNHPGDASAKAQALEAWDGIRRELWSHLQIEDELVFAWGDAHQAMSPALVDTLRRERQELRRLLALLPDLPPGEGRGPESVEACGALAGTLIALAQNLDAHVERYDAEVLPAILRAVRER
jgi:iron-sulfur cluster repair protein YtfE (RIC family)